MMLLNLFVTAAYAGGGDVDDGGGVVCAFVMVFGAIGVMTLGFIRRDQ